MALTVPETEACTGALFLPSSRAISCPTQTWSPGCTTGSAAWPECMFIGSRTSLGTGMRTAAQEAVLL